jgi:hypothetical protein
MRTDDHRRTSDGHARADPRAVGAGAASDIDFALTYANEWENYTIAEAYLNDQRIATISSPSVRSRHGFLKGGLGVAARRWRNTTDNLLDAKKGYVAILYLETAGMAGRRLRLSSVAEGAISWRSGPGRRCRARGAALSRQG